MKMLLMFLLLQVMIQIQHLIVEDCYSFDENNQH